MTATFSRTDATTRARDPRCGSPLLTIIVAGLLVAAASPLAAAPQEQEPAARLLSSSAYPAVSTELNHLWLVPDAKATSRVPKAIKSFAEGVRLQADAKYARALPLVASPGIAATPLKDYATFYQALILLRSGKPGEARRLFAELRTKEPAGYLSEAIRMREAEAAESQSDFQAAAQIYEELSARKPAAPDVVLMGLARNAAAAGDRARAARAFSRLYYDYPLSDLSEQAGAALEGLRDVTGSDATVRYNLDATRAQRLFDARRWAAAEAAFQSLEPRASSNDERERINLRIAECAFYQRRYRDARDKAQPYIEQTPRKAEAQFFYLSSVRELGDHDEYVKLARKLVDEFETGSWVEETLNNLGSHFIVTDQDEEADKTFRDLYKRFPNGKYAERAAWKIGWWSYKRARYEDTATFFEGAAAAFPHSDYRPSYLYWAARAREAAGEREQADARYRLVLTDYRNTYYGRLTAVRYRTDSSAMPVIEPVAIRTEVTAAAPLPDNAEQIRLLLAVGLLDPAMDELQYAQRNGADSPVVPATIAWVHNQRGDLRPGVNLMKRTYPQFMAAGGEQLPVEIRKVMFPVDFWPSIKKQASSRRLDPYLVASLILQESTFSPTVRSGADAVGLMQLLAPTGRQYARKLRIRRFSPAMLTRADINLRLGVAYFADLVQRFGAEHLALASYNAGENRVAEWIGERGTLSREEFIDDIPFPETQNYVKRILGAADDYRMLYGDRATAEKAGAAPAKKPSTVGATKKPTTPAAKKPTTKAVKPAVKKTSAKKKR